MSSASVCVQPVNDLAPVFSSASYTGNILESLAVGSAIGITVSATDPEPGHTVTYFSVSTDTNSAFFHVDRSSGVITLAHAVDADPPTSHSSFSFRVIEHSYLSTNSSLYAFNFASILCIIITGDCCG